VNIGKSSTKGGLTMGAKLVLSIRIRGNEVLKLTGLPEIGVPCKYIHLRTGTGGGLL
jgi:hypothetical protein